MVSTTQTKFDMKSSSSIVSSLVKALHSNNIELLESNLAEASPEVVLTSVQRLPPTYVVPFLNTLVSRFQSAPNRSRHNLKWIKTILLVHNNYLMTIPDVVKKMSNLYKSVDQHSTSYKRLLNLSGRLDLVNSQIEVRNGDSSDSEDEDSVPVFPERADSEDNISDEDMVDLVGDADELQADDLESEDDIDEDDEESELSGDEPLSSDDSDHSEDSD
ncbi:NUC189-domain-containing protein [Basidiobolus meristosporus CBS 931.73]|uniref:NUC189-domain-containing protein n=1 Tax=Basidiobolus meristosporus CBS 931.73 TaxID=1314790 RepID=A0A1Y1YNF3_9FUNG|nr:NUC189-domain-containing protein [Basidiobolus meristosporus CBS 931.73]|eukprot:ORX99363.1 NUC189-domain-containing protein [Basidiobolus meristosporus CBS 931.73]